MRLPESLAGDVLSPLPTGLQAPAVTHEEELTTREGVIALMESATSEEDWDNKCDRVKAANGNYYPDFWFAVMLVSGRMKRIADSWVDRS